MKFSFITGLAVFWSIFLAIMVGGFISYENQKATRLTQGMDEKGGFGDVAGIDGGVGSASDPNAAGTGASSNGVGTWRSDCGVYDECLCCTA
jgi:hypothetical protein